MGTILNPGSDSADYIRAMTSGENSKITLEKKGLKSDSKIAVGKIISGTLKEPVQVGKHIDTLEGNSTSRIESIYETLEDKIMIETKTSLYEVLDVSAPQHREISLKYLKSGILDFHEKIPDSFIDGGRNMRLSIDPVTKVITPISHREILLVDAKQDQALSEKIHRAQKLLQGLGGANMQTKVLVLSMFTSNELGGSQISYSNTETDISDLTDQDLKPFMKNDGSPSYVPLGYLNHGVCRHRALLFKKLADECHIPSRLVRGNYNSATRGWHIWNVVKIDDTYYVVDVMHNPGELYEESSQKAQKYMRKKNGIVLPGFGGHSIPWPNT